MPDCESTNAAASTDSAIHRRQHFLGITSFEENLRKSVKSVDKSMPLKKSVHLFGQLPANAFGRRELLNARFPEAIHRAKPPQ